jgi:hypothetical protein
MYLAAYLLTNWESLLLVLVMLDAKLLPWAAGDIAGLEKIQERAVKAVSGLKGTNYQERLAELEMPSLADRITEADMCLTYKIISDSDKQFSEQWFERAATRRTTRIAAGTNNLVPKRGNHDYRQGLSEFES